MIRFSQVIIFFIALLSAIAFVLPTASFAAGMCPAPTDTGTYVDPRSGRCYSASGPVGFNVIGLRYTCGPVACPGQAGTQGHTCITRESNGLCYAGVGISGFSNYYCTPTSNVPVACPGTMPLYLRVLSSRTGQGVANIPLQVTYEDKVPYASGKTTVVATDSFGNATMWNAVSGDHFMVKPLLANRFQMISPPQIGTTDNMGDQEMNTPWSCGQTPNRPCTFIMNW